MLTKALTTTAITIALIGCGGKNNNQTPAEGNFIAPPINSETYLKVAMHLHGHSNHNGAKRPASMQWISAENDSSKVAGVLWWNDHTQVFDQSAKVSLYYKDATAENKDIFFPRWASNKFNISRFVAKIIPENADSTLDIHPGGATYSILGSEESNWSTYSYQLKAFDGDKVKGLRWVRPISSGAKINLRWITGVPSENTFYEILIYLSWHKSQNNEPTQHILKYRIGNKTPFSTSTENTIQTYIDYEESGNYSLDLMAGAEKIQFGDDNTISDIELVIGSRAGETASVSFRNIEIESMYPSSSHQLNKVFELAFRYSQIYGHRELVGTEYGTTTHHMNAFCEDDSKITELLSRPDDNDDLYAWVELAHKNNCLVSLNHPYGTSHGYWTLSKSNEIKDRSLELANELIRNDIYGADFLEVGYLARGGASIVDHIMLWDQLTSKGQYITAIGVTDTHGDEWKVDMWPNPFITWVGTNTDYPIEILSALKERKALFGNPFLWDGSVNFAVGDKPLGSINQVSNEPHKVVVESPTFSSEHKIFITQGLIKAGELEYVHFRERIYPERDFFVNVSAPSFVRFEVYKGNSKYFAQGEPVLFSNNIFFLNDTRIPR